MQGAPCGGLLAAAMYDMIDDDFGLNVALTAPPLDGWYRGKPRKVQFHARENTIPCPASRWDTVTKQFDYTKPPAGSSVNVDNYENKGDVKLSALEARPRALDLRHGRGLVDLGDEQIEIYVIVAECHRIPVFVAEECCYFLL